MSCVYLRPEKIEPTMLKFLIEKSDSYGKELLNLRCNERFMLRLWSQLVIYCGKWILKTNFFADYLLRIIEKSFSNSNPKNRQLAFFSWCKLVYTFKQLGMQQKRAALLMTPIKASLSSQTPQLSVRLECVKTWVKILYAVENLEKYFDVVISPVLEHLVVFQNDYIKNICSHLICKNLSYHQHYFFYPLTRIYVLLKFLKFWKMK